MSLVRLFHFSHASTSWPQALLLTPIFVAIVQGRRWFALLGPRSLLFLGEISFSIYLLHAIILHTTMQALGIDWRALSLASFILASLAIAGAAVSLTMATFLLIEKPFMHVRFSRDDRRSRVELA